MTNRDLKMLYLKDTGKSIYGIEYRDMANADDLFEYVHWLEEKILAAEEQAKVINKVISDTDEALKLLGSITNIELSNNYKPKKE
jgi:hypothetical protein